MADIVDVQNAIWKVISNGLYPPATYPDGPAGNSIAGMPVLVELGWPDPNSLQSKMAAGKAVITLYAYQTERNTTRYSRAVLQNGSLSVATFTLTQSGQSVTVGGAQPTQFYAQNFAAFVNGVAYLYQSKSGDATADIAAALCALIVVDVPDTTVSGSTISFSDIARIGALRVGTFAPTLQELKRQQRNFQIIVWAATPQARDAIGRIVDIAIGQTQWLPLADGLMGRMIYEGSPYSDEDQKYNIQRRDFVVSVEYATTLASTAAEAIAIETIYSQEAPDGSTMTPPIQTTYT